MSKILKIFLGLLLSFSLSAQDKGTKPPGPNDSPVDERDIKIFKSQMNSFVKAYYRKAKNCRDSQEMNGKAISNIVDVYLDLSRQDLKDSLFRPETRHGGGPGPGYICLESDLRSYEFCIFKEKELRENLDKLINDPAYSSYMKQEFNANDSGAEMYKYFRDLILRVKLAVDD